DRRPADDLDVRPPVLHLPLQPDRPAGRDRPLRLHRRGPPGRPPDRRPLAPGRARHPRRRVRRVSPTVGLPSSPTPRSDEARVPSNEGGRGDSSLTTHHSSLTLVVNPAAGRGRCGKAWPALARALKEAGLAFEAAFTAGPGDATRLAAEALRNGATT